MNSPKSTNSDEMEDVDLPSSPMAYGDSPVVDNASDKIRIAASGVVADDTAAALHDTSASYTRPQQQQRQQPHPVLPTIAEVTPPPTPARESTDSAPSTPKASGGRRRKPRRKRIERAIAVTSDVSATEPVKKVRANGLPLPTNVYEVTLVRRAIRKKDDYVPGKGAFGESPTTSPSYGTKPLQQRPTEQPDNENGEQYGDISLGMKLSVVGGKVIVQHLNPLSDGRASPAQITGLVKRGDVLLTINNKSLVNLPVDQLMNNLSPLSTPDVSGVYQRRLRLKFAAGEGLAMLLKSETAQNRAMMEAARADELGETYDAASDMFSLFPMVDQMGGMPMFTDDMIPRFPKTPEKPAMTELESNQVSIDEGERPEVAPAESAIIKSTLSLDENISQSIASQRTMDRIMYTSEFFAWNENHSDLMRQPINIDQRDDETAKQAREEDRLSLPELIELGRRAIMGAKKLNDKMENVDSGKDVRSFKSWNTTLSLYSRASTRRRYVLDAASLPLRFDKVSEEKLEDDEDNENDSAVASGTSSKAEQLDGDELLLRLAAHDEIWRKQVVEGLEKAIEGVHDIDVAEKLENEDSSSVETAMSNELGNFLLGENMTKILNKKKKPQALPPDEITAVLFDLTTKLSTSVPDEITAAGSLVSFRSSLVPFIGIKRPKPGSDVMLATHFLLEEVLPVWLKTFRPLPWDQRRVLWPLEKASSGGSTATSTFSDDLTLDSMNTNQMSQSVRHQKKKNLRELVEDQELHVETRNETCFLVTYYFSQRLLPRLRRSKENDTTDVDHAVSFVKTYGAYLKMQTCLSYAAVLKAEKVISVLLDVANHDPRHREVMKQFTKVNSMLFYEPTMLSAVVQRLQNIRKESTAERKQSLIDLCASSYPDVRPWQVKKECLAPETPDSEKQGREFKNLYYAYLSLLLHPHDGHTPAQRDATLVKEWCELSVQTPDRRKNFFCVAARTSSDHRVYYRDLLHLLKLSMQVEEYELSLELGDEILDDKKFSNRPVALETLLQNVRQIAHDALETGIDSRPASKILFNRILRLLRKASMSSSQIAQKIFDSPHELLGFIKHLSGSSKDGAVGSEVLRFVRYLSHEAFPVDVLTTLSLWTASRDLNDDLHPFLRIILQRGAHLSMGTELSASLLRLKRARLRIVSTTNNRGATEGSDQDSVWKRMSNGMVAIEK